MNKFSNISIVIPTYNRSQYLNRSLDYWKNFDINLYVVDSSEIYSKPESNSVTYFHTPHLNFAEKIFYILEKITTPYVALCADDDFISKSGLLSSIDYLETHKDFSSAQGRMIGFYLNNDNSVEYYPTYISRMNFKVDHPDALSRIKRAMSEYMHIFYAVHRTESLKESFNVSKEFFNPRGWELDVSMIASLYGKHITLPCFYLARDSQTGSPLAPLSPIIENWMQDPNNQEEITKWRNAFSQSYDNHGDKKLSDGKIVFDEAIALYIGGDTVSPKNIHDLKKAVKSYAPIFLIKLLKNGNYGKNKVIFIFG